MADAQRFPSFMVSVHRLVRENPTHAANKLAEYMSLIQKVDEAIDASWSSSIDQDEWNRLLARFHPDRHTVDFIGCLHDDEEVA